jgi:hypothetical protein
MSKNIVTVLFKYLLAFRRNFMIAVSARILLSVKACGHYRPHALPVVEMFGGFKRFPLT